MADIIFKLSATLGLAGALLMALSIDGSTNFLLGATVTGTACVIVILMVIWC